MTQHYEVEICVKIPTDELGEADIDRAVYEVKDFAERADAIAYARSRLKDDCFGAVQVTPFETRRYEDGLPGLYRDYGDSECVEEDANDAA